MRQKPRGPVRTADTHEGPTACEAVVTAVADAQDSSPEDLDPPLATVVDPDALDRLVASLSDGSAGAITFAYASYEVTVDGDRQVSVTERRAPGPP